MRISDITQEVYDKLLAAYLSAPEQHSFVAKGLGLSTALCKKLWEAGAPRKGYPPLKQAVQEHQAAARAAALDKLAKEKEKAREASVLALADEIRLIDVSRKTVLGTTAILAGQLSTVQRVAQQIEKAIANGAQLSIQEATRFMEAYSRAARNATLAALNVMQAERLRAGAPGDVFKDAAAGDAQSTEQVSASEAQAVIRQTAALADALDYIDDKADLDLGQRVVTLHPLPAPPGTTEVFAEPARAAAGGGTVPPGPAAPPAPPTPGPAAPPAPPVAAPPRKAGPGLQSIFNPAGSVPRR